MGDKRTSILDHQTPVIDDVSHMKRPIGAIFSAGFLAKQNEWLIIQHTALVQYISNYFSGWCLMTGLAGFVEPWVSMGRFGIVILLLPLWAVPFCAAHEPLDMCNLMLFRYNVVTRLGRHCRMSTVENIAHGIFKWIYILCCNISYIYINVWMCGYYVKLWLIMVICLR